MWDLNRVAVGALICSTIIPGAAVLLPAQAQAQGRGRVAVEEMVVTAQRREEKLQETPIAISALTTDDLEVRGLANLQDLRGGGIAVLRILPNSGSRTELALNMRGVFTGDPSQSTIEAGVATYLDDVYMSRGFGLGMELAELERMEVLRGPQGTLFGRNAMGGAVRMISTKPTGEFGFKSETAYGSWDRVKQVIHVNLPEAYGFKVKVDGMYESRDGWIENLDSTQNDPGQYKTYGWRVAARWDALDNLTADYSYDWGRTYQVNNTPLTTVYIPQELTGVAGTDGANAASIAAKRAAFPVPQGISRQDKTPIPLLMPESVTTSQGHTFSLLWQIQDHLSLKSLTAYRELSFGPPGYSYGSVSTSIVVGAAITPSERPPAGFFAAGLLSGVIAYNRQFSEELLLQGDSERVKWTLGAYYWKESGNDGRIAEYGAAFNAAGQAFAAAQPLSLASQPQYSYHDLGMTHYSLYGQATWTPPVLEDRLDVTVGFRHSTDDKTGRRIRNSNFARPDCVTGVVPALQNSDCAFGFTTQHLDPMVTVNYKWTDSLSTYFRYSTSYRTGGANVRSQSFNEYDEENLTAYEIGLKSEWLDGALVANLAGFMTDWDGQQLTFQTVFVSITETLNVDQTLESKGIELDLTWVPMDGLTLTGSYNYLKADNPQILNPFQNRLENVRRPFQPEHSWNFSADYVWPQTSWGTPRAHLDWNGNSFMYFVVRSAAGGDRSLLNLRLSLTDIPLRPFGGDRGSLELSGFVNNLTDAEYGLFGFDSAGIGNQTLIYEDPRSFGLVLKYAY
ncbi:MAG: TonB-dependent receptor [Gammaproteobacteria bacterium]